MHQGSLFREFQMAAATCLKCEGHAFERGRVLPLGEQQAVSVLQCADCGTVAVILDSQPSIESLQQQVASIDAGIMRIVKAMQDLT
jgi:formate dehydrogenase maturation protein FdhE